MKRYETMSKEEILEFMAGCEARNCKDCPAYPQSDGWGGNCAEAYLTEEVPEPLMVRRYQNICCKQDMTEMADMIWARCKEQECSECAYYGRAYSCLVNWFIDYLGELEPEREKEWYLDEKYHKNLENKA